jgi:hypothetical protein
MTSFVDKYPHYGGIKPGLGGIAPLLKVAMMIKKVTTQTYCQIEDQSEQLDQAVQQNDSKKARALVEKIAELNKKMGPEFAALVDIEKRVDLDSPDGQEIASIVATLGESCPH